MQTAYGEFFEEDVETLEYQLQWYLKYGNAPSSFRRESETAKIDYGTQYTAVRLKFPAKHAKYAKSTRPALAGEASPSRAGDDATSVAGAKGHAFHPAPSAASCRPPRGRRLHLPCGQAVPVSHIAIFYRTAVF